MKTKRKKFKNKKREYHHPLPHLQTQAHRHNQLIQTNSIEEK